MSRGEADSEHAARLGAGKLEKKPGPNHADSKLRVRVEGRTAKRSGRQRGERTERLRAETCWRERVLAGERSPDRSCASARYEGYIEQ